MKVALRRPQKWMGIVSHQSAQAADKGYVMKANVVFVCSVKLFLTLLKLFLVRKLDMQIAVLT